jgi:L-fuculose-phosphate aldolase
MSASTPITKPAALAHLQQRVVDVVHEMDRVGLTEGTAGNVSARTAAGEVVLTPTAMRYPEMTVDDLVVTDLQGRALAGERQVTTELDLHLCCLRRHPDIRAVVHTHAVHASMFAVAQQPIPCVLEEFEYHVGGDVQVSAYHRTGTRELGEAVAALLGDRAAALIANHGLVVVGRSPEEALQLTKLVERAARIVWGARSLGEPASLPDPIRREFAADYLARRRAPYPD